MFKGSNVALVTPFKDNKLDEESYIKLINFHLENGTHGLVPAGTTGCLLYTSPSPRDLSTSRMPSSA